MPIFKEQWEQKSYDIYNFPTFSDEFPSATEFKDYYLNCGIPAKLLDTNNINTVYYLLYAQYGNTPIAFTDENQFRYNIMTRIFMYGPSWERRLQVQDRIRALSEEELSNGSMQIYNNALNPSTPIKTSKSVEGGTPIVSNEGTMSSKQIGYINGQNVTINKRGLLEGFAMLEALLVTDVTKDFVKKFNDLFCINASAQRTPLYMTDKD